MPLFRKPLSELTAADIQGVIDRQQQEDIETEFKQALATRDGKPDRWMTDQSAIGNYAKEALTKEIVAFANTQGGTLILGIKEDEDKRATSILEIPKCAVLAERLGQSIMSSTDPKITILDAIGVPTNGDAGVVVFRVPPSIRAPHRDKDTRECYRRRGDNSEPMDMREVQDLTLDRTRSFKRIEDRLYEGVGLPCEKPWLHVSREAGTTGPHSMPSGTQARSLLLCAARAVAVPLEPISLGNLIDNPRLKLPCIPLVLYDKRGQQQGVTGRHAQWSPIMRGIREGSNRPNGESKHFRSINTDGRVVVEIQKSEIVYRDDLQGMPAIWLLEAFAELIASTHLLRVRMGRPDLEFALLFEWRLPPEVNILPSNVSFYDPIRMHEIYNVIADYQLSSGDRLDELFSLIERDFWHATGVEDLVGSFRYGMAASLAKVL
jgi:Putative DNA-binding domain